LDYAEDQAFGRDILQAGYWKVFEPRAAVVHSHTYPLLQYLRRQFDEYRGLRKSIGYVQTSGLRRILLGSLQAGYLDAKYILSQPYSPLLKVRWSVYAFIMNFFRRFAGYLAAREHRLPKGLIRRMSLEAQTRKRAT